MKLFGLVILFVLGLFVSACTQTAVVEQVNENNNVQENQEEETVVETTLPEVLQSPQEKAAKAAYDAGYKGTVLAGKNAFYIEYNQRDYDVAVGEGKVIVLVYYTEGNEASEKDNSEAQAAFYDLEDSNVMGFRVHYTDSKVSVDDKKIAEKFGVINKNTKVIVRDGKQVFKNLDSWNKARYLDEISRNT